MSSRTCKAFRLTFTECVPSYHNKNQEFVPQLVGQILRTIIRFCWRSLAQKYRRKGFMAEELSSWGSHRLLDSFALACHRAVAERLRVAPEPILKHARNNLARWSAQYESLPVAMLSLEEWKKILEELSVESLVTLITEDSDEGQRRRQSTPFAGVLTPEERKELLTACDKKTSAEPGPSRE